MGNYTSIEDLKNDPMLEELIHQSIDSIFTMENQYHEEVKEVTRKEVTSTQAGSNNIKGFMVAGQGTTINLSQTAILDTVMKTSYYTNILSDSNGKPEVKLITSDILGMTEKDNAESEMPNFYDPVYIMNALGFDVSVAEFDFDNQAIRYKIAADEERLEKEEEKRKEDLEREKQERIDNGLPTIEESIIETKEAENVIKIKYEEMNSEYSKKNKELSDLKFKQMQIQIKSDYSESMNKYTELSGRYANLKSEYDKANKSATEKRLQEEANEDAAMKSRWQEEKDAMRQRWNDESKQEDIGSDTNDDETNSTKTTTTTGNSSSSGIAEKTPEMKQEELELEKKHNDEYFGVITKRAENDTKDLLNFEKTLEDDKTRTYKEKVKEEKYNEKGELVTEEVEKEITYTGFYDILDIVSEDPIAFWNWNGYVADERNRLITNQTDNIGILLSNFYYKHALYEDEFKDDRDKIKKIIDDCYVRGSNPSKVKEFIDPFFMKHGENDEVKLLMSSLISSMAKSIVYYNKYKSTINEAENRMKKIESDVPKEMYTIRKSIINLDGEVKKLSAGSSGLNSSFRIIAAEVSRLENLITPLIDSPENGETTYVEQVDPITGQTISLPAGWKSMSFKNLYDILTSGFTAKIEEKVTNIEEKIINLSTNIEVSTRNVSSNEMEIRAVNVTNSYIDIDQFNESRIQLVADFENIGKQLSTLPKKPTNISDIENKKDVNTNSDTSNTVSSNNDSASDKKVVDEMVNYNKANNSDSSSLKWLIIIGSIIFILGIMLFIIAIIKKSRNRMSGGTLDISINNMNMITDSA